MKDGTTNGLTRRRFLISGAGAVIATSYAARTGLSMPLSGPSLLPASKAAVYKCPPCGLDCDKLEFDKPGNCPVCGMALVEKSSLSSGLEKPSGTHRFPDGKHSLTVPFELLANGIFLAVSCNGKGPLNFEMDTGSSSCVIASEIVDILGIKTGASGTGLGSGTKFTSRHIDHVDFVLPGGLVLSSTDATAISMGDLSNLIARRFDGNIGYDVLSQLVVRIDYERRQVTFFDPAYFSYSGSAQHIPFSSWSNYDPQITGELQIEGRPALPVNIVLDTGAGGTTLATPFVNKNQLMQAGKTLRSMDVGAGGGESVRHELRAASLKIGDLTLDRPLMVMATDTIGTFAHAEFDINLGGNILRRFTVTIDYPGKYLILEPNSGFHEPFYADASGLILQARGPDFNTFVVEAVVQSSPAAAADLRVGDSILAINGKSATHYALWQMQDLLKRSGSRCRLEIGRHESTMTKNITLREML